MVRRGLGVVTLVALAACGSSDVVLPLPPELAADGAAVFVVSDTSGDLEVFAAPGDAQRLFSVDLDRSEIVTITALQYATDLAQLGLPEGVVPQISDDVCGARPLPMQDSLHTVTVTKGEPSPWRSVEVPPAEVQGVRVEGPCPCAAFDVEERLVGPSSSFVAWFERPDHTVLLDRDRAFWRLETGGALSMVETATRAPAGLLQAVMEGEGDEIWVVVDGVLWRGSPTASFEAVATVMNDVVRNMSGGTGDEGFELFGATTGGSLLQFTPGEPRLLVGPKQFAFNEQQLGIVRWLGPGEVVASEHASYDLFWVRDGVETARIQLPFATAGAYLMHPIPQLGLLVIDRNAEVMLAAPGGVDELEDAPELATPRFVIPYDDGFVYGGDSGYLAQYKRGFGFCPPQFIEGERPIVGLFELGAHVYAFSRAPDGGPLELLKLAPRPLDPEG